MAKRTKEEIQAEVAAASAARKEQYFAEQAAAKTEAASKLAPTPAPDAFVYSNVWRQNVGGAGGRFNLIKTPNPYYDPSTNTIVDPKTGERVPAGTSYLQSGTAFPEGLPSTPGKTVTSITRNSDGTVTIRYSDGTRTITNATGTVLSSTAGDATGSKVKTDGTPGSVGIASSTGTSNVGVGSSGQSGVGSLVMGNQNGPGTPAYEERKSAYDLLYQQFAQYGLGSLVEPLKGLITEGVSPSEFTLRLRETDAYKKRFAANQSRIQKGLRALSEAEYIGLEDAYQGIMRSYGLPASFYTKGDLGVQQGFEKFLSADVSPAELEDRVQTAQNRVINAAPEIADTLRKFYPGIGNGDILAYALDPESALPEIRRKITAAEIGAGAVQSGLATDMARAEELGRYGVTGQQAREGYQAIADFLPRGGQLAEIYKQSPYTQTTAEQEVFGVPGSVEAAKQRKKLTSLEQASFAGSSGAAQGALARDRAGSF